MKQLFKGHLKKIFVFLILVVIASTTTSFAAIDPAATLADLKDGIYAEMQNKATSYTVNYTGNATTLKPDIVKIMKEIYDADDYLKYTTKSYAYSATIKSGVVTIKFTFDYWNTAAQDVIVNNRVEEIVNGKDGIPGIITVGMNDFAKQKAIHDWIVKNVSYDTTLNKRTAYDALEESKKTVCQGYALLSYKMLDKAGFETKIIEGTARGQAHAWNLVKLDGAWYHFDTTWDDPVPDVPNKVTYNYYNLTDSQIKADHSWVLAYPPAVTDFGTVLTGKLTSDAPKAPVYQGIIDDLELQLLTVKDAVALNFEIQKAMKSSQPTLKVRYLNGNSINSDMQAIIKGITNLTSCSYTKTDYVRSTVTGDIILDLTFNYSLPKPTTGIVLSMDTLKLPIGASSTLVTSISPLDATNKTISWSSDKPEVATVTNGIIKAVSGGIANITAETADGKKDTCIVTVIQGVSGLSLDKTSLTLNKDAVYTLAATITPLNADNNTILWKSSNTAVATVDASGKVTAKAYGTAVIYAASEQDPTKTARCTVLVPVPTGSITINTSSTFIKIGKPIQLNATITPSTATVKTITWSSSDITKAKVSSTGIVTPLSPGKFDITASNFDNTIKATKSFEVINGITSITLTKTSATLKKDEEIKLDPIINPSNATYPGVTWKSSNTLVATVDPTGKVKAIGSGTAIITATNVNDPARIGKCTITVPVPVGGITIKSSTDIVKMGSNLALSAVIAPTNATVKTVAWSSNKPLVATVSATGIVTPVDTGTVTITAVTADGSFSATKVLTVINAIKSISFKDAKIYIKPGDAPISLIPIFNPLNASDQTLEWKSSNPTIATVDASGKVTAETYGTTLITATSKQDPTKIASCTVIVPLPVEGVMIHSSSNILKMGSKLTLTAEITPTKAPIKTVTWSSNDEDIATVSATGVVTPWKPGNVVITATSTANTSIKDSLSLEVVYGVSSVTFPNTAVTIELNDAITLVPTVLPNNANQNLIWKSSNPTVATVTSGGVVTAKNLGTAVIYATSAQDGTKVAKCTVTVPKHVTGITINTSIGVVKMGKPLALTTAIAPADATNKTIIWTSSNTSIAKVSSLGVVTPVAPGVNGEKVIIMATTADGSYFDTIELEVIYAVTSVAINKSSVILDVGAETSLIATVYPNTATNDDVSWESSNTNIADVDANGKVVAKGVGTAIITASSKQDPAKTAKCTITVPVHVTKISLNKTEATMKIGVPLSLSYLLEPANATNKTVTWFSSDTSIAKVSTTGRVTALTAGTVIITVTTNDGAYTSYCTITITN